MKRIVYILIIVTLFILTISFFFKPIIISLVKKQIGNVFNDSDVFFGGCKLMPLGKLSFYDIEINRDRVYNIKIKEAGIYFNPFVIFTKTITNFYLKDTIADINLPQKDPLELKSYLSFKPGNAFLLKNLELSNLNIKLNAKDLKADASISIGLSLVQQRIDYLDLKVNSLDGQDFYLGGAFIKAKQFFPQGELFIQEIKYSKAKINEVRGKVRLEDKSIFLDSLSAEFLDGELEGDLSFLMDKDSESFANLKFTNLDLGTLVNDFDLEDRFQMSGRLCGEMILKTNGLNASVISGNFSIVHPGGTLAIKDDRFLRNLASTSRQSLDLIVESFKEYHYNTGEINLSLDKGDLVLKVSLDGKEGKRDLNITVHNFKLGREEL